MAAEGLATSGDDSDGLQLALAFTSWNKALGLLFGRASPLSSGAGQNRLTENPPLVDLAVHCA